MSGPLLALMDLAEIRKLVDASEFELVGLKKSTGQLTREGVKLRYVFNYAEKSGTAVTGI